MGSNGADSKSFFPYLLGVLFGHPSVRSDITKREQKCMYHTAKINIEIYIDASLKEQLYFKEFICLKEILLSECFLPSNL